MLDVLIRTASLRQFYFVHVHSKYHYVVATKNSSDSSGKQIFWDIYRKFSYDIIKNTCCVYTLELPH